VSDCGQVGRPEILGAVAEVCVAVETADLGEDPRPAHSLRVVGEALLVRPPDVTDRQGLGIPLFSVAAAQAERDDRGDDESKHPHAAGIVT
jgi:hypothetical protein